MKVVKEEFLEDIIEHSKPYSPPCECGVVCVCVCACVRVCTPCQLVYLTLALSPDVRTQLRLGSEQTQPEQAPSLHKQHNNRSESLSQTSMWVYVWVGARVTVRRRSI